MATTIQGYNFDGDPDGLKFIQGLTWDELLSVIYLVDNKGNAHLQSTPSMHFEVTKSSEGNYVIAKTQASGSSSWF
jgi:hypothetical protein